MGPAMFDGAADRIPLESLYLAYGDEEVVPAAGPVPRSWSAASQSTNGNIGVVILKLDEAGFIPDRQYEYQAQAYRTKDSAGALTVYLSIMNPRKPLGNASGPLAMSASAMLFLAPANASVNAFRNAISLGLHFSRDKQSIYAYLNGPGLEIIDHTKILSLEDVFGSVAAMAGTGKCYTCF